MKYTSAGIKICPVVNLSPNVNSATIEFNINIIKYVYATGTAHVFLFHNPIRNAIGPIMSNKYTTNPAEKPYK